MRRALYVSGGIVATGLLAACQQAAPASPTTAPAAKPTAAPPAPAAATQAPAAAKPPVATQAPAAKPAVPADVDTRPLVLMDGQDAVTLDPASAPDVAYSHNLQRGPAEGLLEYVVKPDGSIDVGPLLARAWNAEDNVSFTFELQQGVRFSDGTPFNAEAVRYNFDRIVKLNLTPAGRLPKIERIETPGDYTVRFVLTGPSTDFLYPLTQMLLVSPKALQDNIGDDMGRKWADDNIVGTGPYLIESRSKGTETVLGKNPGYWRGWDGNHLERILVRVVKEPATQRLMMERGEGHIARNIAFTDIDALGRAPGVVIESGQTPGTLHVMMRMRGPLSDPNVRRAIVNAYDYEGLVASTFRGKAELPRGFLYPSHIFHDQSIQPMKRDLSKARELLSRSAHPNGGFELTILILPAFGFYQPAEAQILQDNLKDLNINVNISPQAELATFYASVDDEEKGADMWAWSGAAQLPDYNFQARRQYHTAFKRPAGVNGGYSNARVDALLDEDTRTVDANRRRAIWRELQTIINDEVPALHVATPHLFLVRRAELQGVPLNPFNFVPNYYEAWLKKSGA